jgi:hypothetical protein
MGFARYSFKTGVHPCDKYFSVDIFCAQKSHFPKTSSTPIRVFSFKISLCSSQSELIIFGQVDKVGGENCSFFLFFFFFKKCYYLLRGVKFKVKKAVCF